MHTHALITKADQMRLPRWIWAEAETDQSYLPDLKSMIIYYILNMIELIEDSRSTQTEIDQMYKEIVNVYTSEMTKIFGIKNDNPYSHRKYVSQKKIGGTRAWH